MAERLTEIRVALVLYGGVSLAVYENGVVRCFYDLVKKKGIYGPLLEMLEADATVDVVAGTSAGGINGLMLGAALENGTDFLAPGCGVAPQTPLENILQLQKARNDYFAKAR